MEFAMFSCELTVFFCLFASLSRKYTRWVHRDAMVKWNKTKRNETNGRFSPRSYRTTVCVFFFSSRISTSWITHFELQMLMALWWCTIPFWAFTHLKLRILLVYGYRDAYKIPNTHRRHFVANARHAQYSFMNSIIYVEVASIFNKMCYTKRFFAIYFVKLLPGWCWLLLLLAIDAVVHSSLFVGFSVHIFPCCMEKQWYRHPRCRLRYSCCI